MATADVSGIGNPLVKLLQHQTKEADIVKEKVRKLTIFKEDYEALKTRLESLPDKISHHVMVPFGRLAFIPGKVKHTNEILCLLGDNWFAERSAKQAAQIVERRIRGINETLTKFNGELKLIDGWCDQTKKLGQELDLNPGVNIVEMEEGEEWREEHRKKVREHKQKLAAFKSAISNHQEESHERSEEEELWRRLDELELEEELQHELDLLGVENGEWEDEGEEEPKEEEENCEKKKSVRWSQSPDAVKQFRRDEQILPSSLAAAHEGDYKNQDTLKITFKHSPVSSAAASSNKRKGKLAAFADSQVDPSSSSPSLVSSPSEIFGKFGSNTTTTEFSGGETSSQSEPKSILKVKKSTTPVIEIVQRRKQKQEKEGQPDTTGPDHSSLLQQQQQITAVGDEVKERVETAEGGREEESVNTHRPVSRFRAARMSKKL